MERVNRSPVGTWRLASWIGTSPDGTIVEIMERRDHPWFLAVQCHPEFRSKPMQAHPLFRDFVGAAAAYRGDRIRAGDRIVVTG